MVFQKHHRSTTTEISAHEVVRDKLHVMHKVALLSQWILDNIRDEIKAVRNPPPEQREIIVNKSSNAAPPKTPQHRRHMDI